MDNQECLIAASARKERCYRIPRLGSQVVGD